MLHCLRWPTAALTSQTGRADFLERCARILQCEHLAASHSILCCIAHQQTSYGFKIFVGVCVCVQLCRCAPECCRDLNRHPLMQSRSSTSSGIETMCAELTMSAVTSVADCCSSEASAASVCSYHDSPVAAGAVTEGASFSSSYNVAYFTTWGRPGNTPLAININCENSLVRTMFKNPSLHSCSSRFDPFPRCLQVRTHVGL